VRCTFPTMCMPLPSRSPQPESPHYPLHAQHARLPPLPFLHPCPEHSMVVRRLAVVWHACCCGCMLWHMHGCPSKVQGAAPCPAQPCEAGCTQGLLGRDPAGWVDFGSLVTAPVAQPLCCSCQQPAPCQHRARRSAPGGETRDGSRARSSRPFISRPCALRCVPAPHAPRRCISEPCC
jgi:hypothetical protein